MKQGCMAGYVSEDRAKVLQGSKTKQKAKQKFCVGTQHQQILTTITLDKLRTPQTFDKTHLCNQINSVHLKKLIA